MEGEDDQTFQKTKTPASFKRRLDLYLSTLPDDPLSAPLGNGLIEQIRTVYGRSYKMPRNK